jgi:hypothetical protein
VASNLVLPWSSKTRRRAGPASVPATSIPHRALVVVIIFGRSEATTQPRRQTGRKNTASHHFARGTAVRKLRFDAGCLVFLHCAIEHARASARFTKLRIGDQRGALAQTGARKAPPARAGLRGTFVEVFPVPSTGTIPAHLCPSPYGYHERTRFDERWSLILARDVSPWATLNTGRPGPASTSCV